ncbi:hypothetical protein FRC15_001117 [Serendipita sp. 397]|nr:hypothetical protein FRC15_001117 [Serendipita sp. 397]
MLGASNPIRELISEAHALFGGSASVASLVSLGAGNLGVIAMGVDASSETWASKLQSMIADGERVASEVVKQIGNRGFYFRLSVQLGVQEAIASGISLSKISSLTSDYLQDPEVSNKLEECITSLEFRLGLTTLEQLKYSGGGRATHRSLPPITASFVERSGPWTILVNNLIDVECENTQRILVVSGLGGCGKSTLVTKFAAEYQARSVHYLHAIPFNM